MNSTSVKCVVRNQPYAELFTLFMLVPSENPLKNQTVSIFFYNFKNHPRMKLKLTFGVLLTLVIGFISSLSIIAILDIFVIFIFTFLLLLLYFNNGKLKKFLSLKIWMPISKMGLSIYLICSYIQFGIWRHQMEPLEIENFSHFVSKK